MSLASSQFSAPFFFLFFFGAMRPLDNKVGGYGGVFVFWSEAT